MKPDILNPTGRNHVVVSAPSGHLFRCRGCGLRTSNMTEVAAHVVRFQYVAPEEPAK